MADWVGFSDADIERMKCGETPDNKKKSQPKIAKPVAVKNRQATLNSKRAPNNVKRASNVKRNNSTPSNVPSAALLSQPETKMENVVEPVIREKSETTQEGTVQKDSILSSVETASTKTVKEREFFLDDDTIKEKEKIKLEDVRIRQKQMEEKNKKKKEMLANEIAQRKKKAFAESHKLVKIQDELTKLDQMLNNDVSILRDKIEEACMDFSQAQKRFTKAESEYVEAKMDLHFKTTKKEDLTEHLYHLIQANEERKAKKLEELMNKLDVEEDELEAKQEQLRKEQELREQLLEKERLLQETKSAETTKSVVSSEKAGPAEGQTSSEIAVANEEPALEKNTNSGPLHPSAAANPDTESLHGENAQS